jgi:hypothetical protein
MRAAVNAVLLCCAIAASQTVPSLASSAEPKAQPGDDRWLPSLAITSGVTFQEQRGSQSSVRLENSDPNTLTPLRPTRDGEDRVVSPYVGAAFEISTPSLPILSRPRAFATAEILPTFGSERQLSIDGDPSEMRGPEVGAVNADEEDNTHYTTDPRYGSGPRQIGFGETDAAGLGMRQAVQVKGLVYGAKIGASFSFELRGRQTRIKPSLGWIHYDVESKGYMVTATCNPTNNCTNTYTDETGQQISAPGDFRHDAVVQGSDTGTFDGIGPGIDLEMDTGRYGPIRTSLFLGIHAYYIPGDRDITYTATKTYSDSFGPDTDVAMWRTRVTPWLYRGGVGIRFQWLGSAE